MGLPKHLHIKCAPHLLLRKKGKKINNLAVNKGVP